MPVGQECLQGRAVFRTLAVAREPRFLANALLNGTTQTIEAP